jgi:hypothetical protein
MMARLLMVGDDRLASGCSESGTLEVSPGVVGLTIELDRERGRSVEDDVMGTCRWNCDVGTSPDAEALIGFVFEHESDGAGVHDETPPDARSDAMRPEQPCGRGFVVEHICGARELETVRDLVAVIVGVHWPFPRSVGELTMRRSKSKSFGSHARIQAQYVGTGHGLRV